jgi:hypothetical protein
LAVAAISDTMRSQLEWAKSDLALCCELWGDGVQPQRGRQNAAISCYKANRRPNMDDDSMRALHWLPDENRWVEIDWDEFLAFREFMVPFRSLPGVAGGVH